MPSLEIEVDALCSGMGGRWIEYKIIISRIV